MEEGGRVRRARPLGSGCPGFRWPVPGQALPGPCHGSAFQRRFRIFRLHPQLGSADSFALEQQVLEPSRGNRPSSLVCFQVASQLRLFDPQLKEKPEEEALAEPAWLVRLQRLEKQAKVPAASRWGSTCPRAGAGGGGRGSGATEGGGRGAGRHPEAGRLRCVFRRRAPWPGVRTGPSRSAVPARPAPRRGPAMVQQSPSQQIWALPTLCWHPLCPVRST